MPIPNIDIRIQNEAKEILFFDYVVEGEVVSTWRELTNTAKFTLPRKVGKLNGGLLDIIQVGNEVKIRLGYDGELVEEFAGYITKIGSKVPVEIECQDLMWKLKQTEVSGVWRNATLDEVIKKIMPAGIKTEVTGGYKLGAIRLSKVSIASFLDKLKENGITSFVRKGVLHVGNTYNASWRDKKEYSVDYHFQKNIIENDLSYKLKKDVQVKLECSSLQNDGKQIKYTYPENITGDAELHTLHASNGLTKSELKKFAIAKYSKFEYDGYRGTFLTFGSPWCDHGFKATLSDDIYTERQGNYLIDKVVTRFGLRGYRREITLGGKI